MDSCTNVSINSVFWSSVGSVTDFFTNLTNQLLEYAQDIDTLNKAQLREDTIKSLLDNKLTDPICAAYVEKQIEENKSKNLKQQINSLPDIIKPVAKELLLLFSEHNISRANGIDKSLAVYNHVRYALHVKRKNMGKQTIFEALAKLNISIKESENIKTMAGLAALLHNVDNIDLFPNSVNNCNARYLLRNLHSSDIELVLKMIDYCYTNYQDININNLENKLWLLYPRWACQIEYSYYDELFNKANSNYTTNYYFQLEATVRLN